MPAPKKLSSSLLIRSTLSSETQTCCLSGPSAAPQELPWNCELYLSRNGGGGGIRTHETLSGLTVFKTAAFNRSATPPKLSSYKFSAEEPLGYILPRTARRRWATQRRKFLMRRRSRHSNRTNSRAFGVAA